MLAGKQQQQWLWHGFVSNTGCNLHAKGGMLVFGNYMQNAETGASDIVVCMHTLMMSSTDWACLPWFFEAVVTCKQHTTSFTHSSITRFFPGSQA